MKRVLLILLVQFLLLLPRQGNAQKNYSVTHYNGDNGLPQNSVKSIAADADGFIWLATEDGLVRFDGQHFYVFNEFNLKVRWNRVNYIKPGTRSDKAGNNRVLYASFYSQEEAKIENGTAALDTVRQKNVKYFESFIKTLGNAHASLGLPDRITRMERSCRYMVPYGEKKGDFYLCAYDQVSFYKDFKKKYNLPFHTGAYWNFFTIADRLFYMHENASFQGVLNGKVVDMALSGDIVNDRNYEVGKSRIKIFWNNISDQTFLYLDQNLYTLDLSAINGRNVLVTRLLVEDFDLVSKGIEKIHHDKVNRKVYLGSGTDGFYVLSKHQFQAMTAMGDYLQNVFYAQLPYGNNAVFTASGDVVGKDQESGKMIDRKIPYIRAVNFANKRTLVRDKYGNAWIPEGKSVFKLDSVLGKVIEVGHFSNSVDIMHIGKSDFLWVGEANTGLHRISLKQTDPKSELYIKNRNLDLTCLESVSKDKLLAGTWKGLYALDIPSKKVTLIAGTQDLAIKSIHAFADGNIFITALGSGLMLMDKTGKLTTFPLDKNRYLANPHCVVNDGRGYIWIPTNKGLFQILIKDLLDYARLQEKSTELFYQYHTKEAGFNTNEFNGNCTPCGLNLANGYISLPSMNGFVWFRPEQINNAASDGKIVLDNALVNKELLTASNDTMYFPLNPNQVKLNFSTAYFGHPYNLKISYALVKENASVKPSDWIPMDNVDFKIGFSNLQSGNYTLVVRKLNGFGINNYTTKKIFFVVPLLWYQTWWASVLLVLLLIAGIYVFNVWKLRNVKFENARLEEVVAKRTTRLNETLMDLEVSKNEMTRQVHMLSRLLTSMTHDIQSPLNFIRLTSGNIPKMIQKEQYEDVALVGKVISDSSLSMSSLLSGLLDYIKAHVYENSLHFENIDLWQLVDEKFGIFKNMMIENRTDFKNEIGADTRVYCDRQMLGIMIHNLLDNAAKFTRNGEIRVCFNINGETEQELVISNTTVGVPMELQDMINSPETKNMTLPVLKGAPNPVQARTSLGLLIVKEIAALLGITLRVCQSDVTSFYLIFNHKEQ
ncbi:ATP-binding protein [Dyadobacter sp. 3J3]|uniref:ligand-binding sensor domain-containing protein n=1 Tax=Dyadobacter sp. 3J3 TaxID=2606600 RepID=UPI00135A450A|nr:HAMP domain-containing sensor histidine kinase [Dyadobacter sp. 3J3]